MAAAVKLKMSIQSSTMVRVFSIVWEIGFIYTFGLMSSILHKTSWFITRKSWGKSDCPVKLQRIEISAYLMQLIVTTRQSRFTWARRSNARQKSVRYFHLLLIIFTEVLWCISSHHRNNDIDRRTARSVSPWVVSPVDRFEPSQDHVVVTLKASQGQLWATHWRSLSLQCNHWVTSDYIHLLKKMKRLSSAE